MGENVLSGMNKILMNPRPLLSLILMAINFYKVFILSQILSLECIYNLILNKIPVMNNRIIVMLLINFNN